MPKKQTLMQFIQKANDINNYKYDYSKTHYTNSKTEVEIICPKHGSFFQKPVGHINRHNGCVKCSYEDRAKSRQNQNFIQNANKIHNCKYDYSNVDYVNGQTDVEIICPKHGSFFQKPKQHLYREDGCPSCGGTKRRTQSSIIEESKNIHNDKYDYSKVQFINLKTKVEIICPKHGSFFQHMNQHIHLKTGCPRCSSSKGELEIEKFLKNNNIKYVTEYIIHGCRHKLPLPFDFYLTDLNILIEYDGIQHFKPIKFFGGDEGLKNTKLRDQIKTDFVKNNDYILYRIRYNQDIQEELKRILL